MNKENDILFDSELISRVAGKLDMPEPKIKHHLEFFKKEIDRLAWEDGIHSIILPHVGTLYRNARTSHYLHTTREYRESSLSEKSKKVADKCKSDFDDLFEQINHIDHYVHHFKKKRLKNLYFTLRKKRVELEKFQNDDQ